VLLFDKLEVRKRAVTMAIPATESGGKFIIESVLSASAASVSVS
jgi:hypothetical protein